MHTINVASALPTITEPLTLDATTDDSFAANSNRPAIVLDGNDVAASGLVLSATADNSTVRGFVIRDFGSSGIQVQAGADNVTIVSNYIGQLDASGADAGAGEGNTFYGVHVLAVSTSPWEARARRIAM